MNPVITNGAPMSLADNIKRGAELSHFAELLFLRSSHEWHSGVGLEMATGFTMVLAIEVGLPDEIKLLVALFGLVLFGVAYYLRFMSEDTFDMAETMRRQAAMSEGLGWPLNNHQFSEWKRRAGKQVLEQFKNSSRPVGFYDTKESPGPRKLLELTLESAFWTRRLYHKLRGLMWCFFFVIVGLALLIISLSVTQFTMKLQGVQLVSSVFLLLPAILLFDLLEWIFRLARLTDSIKEVEIDMERLEEQPELNETQVLRLVSEFNCIVSNGFPIHPKLYGRWHDEIKAMWDLRV